MQNYPGNLKKYLPKKADSMVPYRYNSFQVDMVDCSGSIEVDPDRELIIDEMRAGGKTLRAIATYSIWVDTDPVIARARIVQRDLAHGENGGTVESITEFADGRDSLLLPLFLEDETWKYADVIVNGLNSDLSSDNLLIHVPMGNENYRKRSR